MEGLTRLVLKAQHIGLVEGFKAKENGEVVAVLQYADDISYV